ncbi:MAG: amidohydrolase [Candidatus Sericytochromatia bacterium]|nr:amidohydrolase [Candidatus Sericytochromatia bacterium]
MKIDIHTHIMPPDLPDFSARFGYDGYISLQHQPDGSVWMWQNGQRFRQVQPNCFDAETRLRECAEHGVELQVLSTIPVLFNYWAPAEHALVVSRCLNDHIADVVRQWPQHFIGLGTLPLQSPELAISELERCVRELGLAGVEIGTHVQGLNLDDPGLFRVLEAAQDLGAAVFVHPWDMRGSETIQKYWLPWLLAMPFETAVAMASLILGGVLEKLPRLRIAFAHGGGSFGCLMGRIEHGFHVRPDLCNLHNLSSPRDYLDRVYVDSLVHELPALQELLRVYGPEHVCLGSDYPFPLGEAVPGSLIERADLSPALRQRLLAGNALDWLGLSGQGT